MNAIGRVADFHGKLPVYLVTAGASVLVTLLLTQLPRVPLWGAILVMCLFMTTMSGRFVPAMAMVTTAGVPALRGGFMSLNSAITQFASATATYLSGFLVETKGDGSLVGFDQIGWVSAALALVAMTFAPALAREASARVASAAPRARLDDAKAEIGH